MLVPLLCLLLLGVMIRRTARKHNVTSQLPLAVCSLVFFAFILLSRGMIKVRSESEIAGAMLLGILLYAGVVGVLYAVAFVWIRQLAVSKKEVGSATPAPSGVACRKCGAAMAENERFCAACGAEK